MNPSKNRNNRAARQIFYASATKAARLPTPHTKYRKKSALCLNFAKRCAILTFD